MHDRANSISRFSRSICLSICFSFSCLENEKEFMLGGLIMRLTLSQVIEGVVHLI